MSEVNAATLVAAYKSFHALWRETYTNYQPRWQSRAMVVPSEHASENYNWLGRVPAMREWIDQKVIKELIGFDFSIKAKDWESTIAVDRNAVEDDVLGMYNVRIQDLSLRAAAHPDKRLSQIRVANGLCYDGQNFYDTDHAEGSSGSQSNKLTGTGTSAAQVRADFFAAQVALMNYKDDQGEPFVLGMDPTQLIAVIPANLLAVFDELNNPAPGSTVPKTMIRYEVDQYLTDVNDWYLDYVGMPYKPFIKQDRKAVSFVSLTDPNNSETVFKSKQFLYGVEGRYEVGLGLWQMSIKTTNT